MLTYNYRLIEAYVMQREQHREQAAPPAIWQGHSPIDRWLSERFEAGETISQISDTYGLPYTYLQRVARRVDIQKMLQDGGA